MYVCMYVYIYRYIIQSRAIPILAKFGTFEWTVICVYSSLI